MVTLGRAVDRSLRELGCSRDLSVFEAPNARHALRVILRLQSPVVVVEVSRFEDETLRLLRLLANTCQSTCVIAVAATHDDGTERAIWKAGSTCYLPCAESQVLDQVLEAVLEEPNWGARDGVPGYRVP